MAMGESHTSFQHTSIGGPPGSRSQHLEIKSLLLFPMS